MADLPVDADAVQRRLLELDIDSHDAHFLVGWLTSAVPAQMQEALDGLERHRTAMADLRTQHEQAKEASRG